MTSFTFFVTSYFTVGRYWVLDKEAGKIYLPSGFTISDMDHYFRIIVMNHYHQNRYSRKPNPVTLFWNNSFGITLFRIAVFQSQYPVHCIPRLLSQHGYAELGISMSDLPTTDRYHQCYPEITPPGSLIREHYPRINTPDRYPRNTNCGSLHQDH